VKKPVLLHGVSSKEKAMLVAFSHKLTRSSRQPHRKGILAKCLVKINTEPGMISS
jgi:hypothetical protein